MKWIGQHIVDLIARFRSDVYLEDISTGTIVSNGHLGLDSNNKIVKAVDGATDLSRAGVDGSANQLLTDDGDGTVTSEAYLSFSNGSNISRLALYSNEDTGDYFYISTTTHGATTLTTTDDDATAAHFEIAADGDIILDSAGQIKLEPVAGNNILLDGTVTIDGGSVTGITTLGVDSVSVTAVQTSAEAFADDDTSIMTSASINDRINRPDKQIVLMRAGFRDDVGTDKHYVPLQSELEQILYYHEMNGFVAPYSGKLLKVMYRASGNLSGGDVTFTLEQIDRNEAFLTTPDVLETITVTGPTNNTTDPNMVTANFVGGSGTNAFVAGDYILLGMQYDTDVTASGSKHFLTLVFEFDFSGVAQ
jgi:hypothetical protein